MIDTVADIKRKMEAEREYTAGWRCIRDNAANNGDELNGYALKLHGFGMIHATQCGLIGRDISWSRTGYVEGAR